MNGELVVLRALHVLPGVLWVGAALAMTWVIEPKLRAAGPTVQWPAMRAIGKTFSLVLSVAAGITILMWFALISRTPGHGFGDLFTTSWGWAIGVGMVTGLIAAGIGSMAGSVLRKMDALGAQISGAPTPEQAAAMAVLQGQMRRNGRVSSVFAVIAVVAMAAARYV